MQPTTESRAAAMQGGSSSVRTVNFTDDKIIEMSTCRCGHAASSVGSSSSGSNSAPVGLDDGGNVLNIFTANWRRREKRTENHGCLFHWAACCSTYPSFDCFNDPESQSSACGFISSTHSKLKKRFSQVEK